MLKDETLHEDKTLPRIKDVESLAKSYVHVRKQVPLDKIARPSEHFTDADWEEFHKAGGRPDTAADYALTRHEEIPEEAMPQEAIDSFQELLHKHGASKKLSDAIHEWNTDRVLQARKMMAEKAEADSTAISDGLHTLWGGAYDQNVHRGNIAMSRDADFEKDADYAERVKAKVSADADLIRHLSNIGSKFVEHKIVEDLNVPTPGDIQERINAEMAKPEYIDRAHPNHKYQVKKVSQLFQEKAKYSKTG
jgi:hypothetical protein